MNSNTTLNNRIKHQILKILYIYVPMIALHLTLGTAVASDFPAVIYHNCKDGDTCTFTIPDVHPLLGKNIKVKLEGLDAPQLNGQCAREARLAKQAKELTQSLLEKAKRIDLINSRRGTMFNLSATILADGKDVGQALRKKHLAVHHGGGTYTGDWCLKRRSFGLEIPYTPEK